MDCQVHTVATTSNTNLEHYLARGHGARPGKNEGARRVGLVAQAEAYATGKQRQRRPR